MEVDKVSRREVHVLHVCALLVAQVCWRYVHVLVMGVAGYRALEDELRVRYAGRACVLMVWLIALVLVPGLRLFALD